MADKANGCAVTAGKVEDVPYKTMSPYLTIAAPRCQEAIEWYKKVFGVKELEKFPSDKRKKGHDAPLIMHAHLKLGPLEFMLADDMEFTEEEDDKSGKAPAELPKPILSLNIACTDVDAVYERAVKEGARVTMPLADQFWGDRYGMFVDPFGHSWATMAPIKKPDTSAETPAAPEVPAVTEKDEKAGTAE